MRFLITGGAGFIGSALVRHLIRETTHEVVVVDKLTYAGNLKSLAPIANDSRYRFIRGDIVDAASMGAIISLVEPDVIVHLAAESHVDRSIDEAEVFIRTNVLGTSVLLDAALSYWRRLPAERQKAFRFHHVSTDEVFGELGDDGLFGEDSPYRPRSPYAASKAASDHLVRAFHHTHGLPVVLSNAANNYGPCQHPEKLIPAAIRSCLEGLPVAIFGTGEQIRDWLFVNDHVTALLAVAWCGRVGESYNVGSNCELGVAAVASAVCEMMDRFAPNPLLTRHASLIAHVADRPGNDHRYAIDAAKIRGELGWAPQEDFYSGLEKTVRWHIANRDHWNPNEGYARRVA